MNFSAYCTTKILEDYFIRNKTISEIAQRFKCKPFDINKVINLYTSRKKIKQRITKEDIIGYVNSNYGIRLHETLNSYLNRKNNTIYYKIVMVPLEIVGLCIITLIMIPIVMITT